MKEIKSFQIHFNLNLLILPNTWISWCPLKSEESWCVNKIMLNTILIQNSTYQLWLHSKCFKSVVRIKWDKNKPLDSLYREGCSFETLIYYSIFFWWNLVNFFSSLVLLCILNKIQCKYNCMSYLKPYRLVFADGSTYIYFQMKAC